MESVIHELNNWMGFWHFHVRQWGGFMPHVVFHPPSHQFNFVYVCHLVSHVVFMLFTYLFAEVHSGGGCWHANV